MGNEDRRVPPDVPALLTSLRESGVEFILAGSVAVEAWGVEVGTPGDLDIVPAMERINLARLARLLADIEAKAWPVTGRWVEEGSDFGWEEYSDDDPRRTQSPTAPDPDRPESFDSLFSTRLGELDIVPRIGGTYEWLRPHAVRRTVRDVDSVLVTHLNDLLSFLTIPRRRKDAARVAALRERQRTLDRYRIE